ncbi:MAG: hypothetical protein WAV47_17380 [Blastocatellia bacterium]
MKREPATGVLRIVSTVFCFCVVAAAAITATDDLLAAVYQSPEINFSLTKHAENQRQYNLLITDTDEHITSGSFSVEQLQILRAIMVEADKFALTGEAAGTREPITTRFMDKQEQSFIVDVQKMGVQSQLFLTVRTENDRRTWDAGKILRTTRREEGFFFALLSRLESLLPKLPAQNSK